MRKIIRIYLSIFAPVMLMLCFASAALFPLPAEAVPGDTKDLSGGCWTEGHRWIAFGEYNGKPLIWRILEAGEGNDGSPVAFLLAEDAVADMPFDDFSNDWNSSDIKRWLNEDFYRSAFSKQERDAIVNHTYSYGGKSEGSNRTAASKVFLLSMDEAKNKRFFVDDADRFIGTYWRLRSPGSLDVITAYVERGGGVYVDGDLVVRRRAVRPALKINLLSSIFTSPTSKYEILYPVTVKMRDAYGQPIYGAAVTADSPKQKYFTGEDGTVLMKLGAGKQKIRVLAAGREAREIMPDVRSGECGIVVDIPASFTYEMSIPISAEAVSDDAGDLRGGVWTEGHRWMTFGERDEEPIIWRILEAGEADDGSPMAFLLAEDMVAEYMVFPHYSNSNDWNGSYIKRWLNDNFYNDAFSGKERDAIVEYTYSYGGNNEGSDRTAKSKIFLLSTDDAESKSYFANDADRTIRDMDGYRRSWWLRSPGDNDDEAAHVNHDGGVYSGFVDYRCAIRPALKINLASPIFTSPFSKYEILYPVTVKAHDADNARSIRGAAVAADSPKQKYFTGDDGTVEMKLRAGRQTIRLSAASRGVYEVTLDVKPGGGSIVVDM